MSKNEEALTRLAFSRLEACEQTEIGVVLVITTPETSDVVSPALRAKQILYKVIKDNRARFGNIQIRFHPTDPENRLLLLNRSDKENET